MGNGMDFDLIISCLEKYSAEKEHPPKMLTEQDVKEWRVRNLKGAMEDALLHDGLIEKYNISPNISIKRLTYKGLLELARLVADRESQSSIGKIRKYGWYAITAIASSAMTILTTWAMKKLGL